MRSQNLLPPKNTRQREARPGLPLHRHVNFVRVTSDHGVSSVKCMTSLWKAHFCIWHNVPIISGSESAILWIFPPYATIWRTRWTGKTLTFGVVSPSTASKNFSLGSGLTGRAVFVLNRLDELFEQSSAASATDRRLTGCDSERSRSWLLGFPTASRG